MAQGIGYFTGRLLTMWLEIERLGLILPLIVNTVDSVVISGGRNLPYEKKKYRRKKKA